MNQSEPKILYTKDIQRSSFLAVPFSLCKREERNNLVDIEKRNSMQACLVYTEMTEMTTFPEEKFDIF